MFRSYSEMAECRERKRTHTGEVLLQTKEKKREHVSCTWCNKQGGKKTIRQPRLLSSSLGRQTQPQKRNIKGGTLNETLHIRSLKCHIKHLRQRLRESRKYNTLVTITKKKQIRRNIEQTNDYHWGDGCNPGSGHCEVQTIVCTVATRIYCTTQEIQPMFCNNCKWSITIKNYILKNTTADESIYSKK